MTRIMGNLCSRSSLNFYDGFVVEGRYLSNHFRTKGLAIDPVTSNLYVCDDILFGIKVFSSNFDFLFTFTTPSLQEAWGICISQDKVFITKPRTSVIFVFTIEGRSLLYNLLYFQIQYFIHSFIDQFFRMQKTKSSRTRIRHTPSGNRN